jgi:hypothetical protein
MSEALFIIIGLAGLWAHWLKRYWRGQTQNTFWCYLFRCEVRATKAASLAFAVSMFGYLATEPSLTVQSAYAAFGIGYMIDSAVNNG